MKINIDELTYDEVREVVEWLRNMKMEAKVHKLGSTFVLQTENGPMQVPEAEGVDVLGLPAVF